MKYGFIYKTACLITNLIYIGQRKISNTKQDNDYLGSGLSLKKDIKLYGKENFIRVIIQYCSKNNIDKREEFWIKFYDATNPNIGYNITISAKKCIINGKRKSLMNKNRLLPVDFGRRVSNGHNNLSKEEKLNKLLKFKNTIKNRSETKKKQIFAKQSKNKKGQIPWNKNKTGLQISWNKGLTKQTDDRVANASLKMKKPKTAKHKNNLSINKKKLYRSGKIKIWNKGMKFKYKPRKKKLLLI